MSHSLPQQPSSMQHILSRLHEPIARDLDHVNNILRTALHSNQDYVNQLVEHVSRRPGKKIRPTLLLLSAKACGPINERHYVLASAIEMIHMASLVHDDILDNASLRRHQPTVYAKWGSKVGLLMGDYLLMQAFQLTAALDSLQACRLISQATTKTCLGEFGQISQSGNLELKESDYLDFINGKTAELFATSCRLGAHASHAAEEVERTFEEYGRNLGMAFQIVDDILDFTGQESRIGKSLGTDCQQQKLTLPLIWFLRHADGAVKEEVQRLLQTTQTSNQKIIGEVLEAAGALQYAADQAGRYAYEASQALSSIPRSPAVDLLQEVASFAVSRHH